METFTTGQVATLLGTSSQTIRRLIDQGAFKAIQLGMDDGWYRITRQEIEDYAGRKGIVLDWTVINKQ